jgi:hypothetical protein
LNNYKSFYTIAAAAAGVEDLKKKHIIASTTTLLSLSLCCLCWLAGVLRANLPSAIGSHVILGFLVFGVPYCIYCFCIARYFAFCVTGEFAFLGLIISS